MSIVYANDSLWCCADNKIMVQSNAVRPDHNIHRSTVVHKLCTTHHVHSGRSVFQAWQRKRLPSVKGVGRLVGVSSTGVVRIMKLAGGGDQCPTKCNARPRTGIGQTLKQDKARWVEFSWDISLL